MDNERSVPGCMVVMAVITAMALSVWACGSTPQENARRTVSIAAEAVDLTDQVFAQRYTARAAVALEAATSLPEYRTSMAPLDAVVRALATGRAALELGDAAVRVWDQGGASSWPQALACIVGALIGLRDVLTAAGVALPAELTAALDMVRGLADPNGCFVDGGL